MESRVIIAIVARKYDFVKVGLGESVLSERDGRPEVDEYGQFRAGEELYNVSIPFHLTSQVRDEERCADLFFPFADEENHGQAGRWDLDESQVGVSSVDGQSTKWLILQFSFSVLDI